MWIYNKIYRERSNMKKNQILVSEAFYVTPEMKKKKLMYKINFFVALILMIVLFSYYAYA